MRTLFIISDLHLGGRPHDTLRDGAVVPGYQFNQSYPALIEFIDWTGMQADAGKGREVELVINGDIVDFLAEDDYQGGGALVWTADEKLACDKLDLIALRTRGAGNRGVFDALKDFVQRGNRLTLLLGNHDIELALPAVRRHLAGLLGGDRAGLLTFIYDGEAYRAGRVLIEHGNRYDRWNMIDHDGLREERSARSRGLAVDETRRGERYFMPPAGTYLVINVMNRLKARYRFIDLLKPETGAVLPLLLALEPALAKYLDGVIKGYLGVPAYLKAGLRTPTEPYDPGLMGAKEAAATTLDQVLAQELGASAALFAPLVREAGAAGSANPDLMSIRDKVRTGMSVIQTWLGQQWEAGTDGIAALARKGTEAISDLRLRQLHAALRRVIQRDGSFDPWREDHNYLAAARDIVGGGDIDVVVNGHTHLPKRIRIDAGARECWYLNTGTWCDVLRLPKELDQDFEQALPALHRFLAALGSNDLQDYVTRYLSYVEVQTDPERAQHGVPALRAYCGRGHERDNMLTPFPAAAPTQPPVRGDDDAKSIRKTG